MRVTCVYDGYCYSVVKHIDYEYIYTVNLPMWTSWIWTPLYSGLWTLFLGLSRVNNLSEVDTCLSSSYFFHSVKFVHVYAHWFNYYDKYAARVKESIENNTEWYTQEISQKWNRLVRIKQKERTKRKRSELHVLISELESKMSDLYLDSKMSKQSGITDFCKKHW
jgi:hypothetical protein